MVNSFSAPCVIIRVLADVWSGSCDVVLLDEVSVSDFVTVKNDLNFFMSAPSEEDLTIPFS